jgi:L-ribulose-5-phosphate 3-epimerase
MAINRYNEIRGDSMSISIITDQLNQDFEKACAVARHHGFDFVEIHSLWGKTVEDLSSSEIKTVKEILNKYHLRVSNLASTIFFMAKLYPNDTISSFNDTFYVVKGKTKDHIEAAKRSLDIAVELDCPSIRAFPFRAPDNRLIIGVLDDQREIIDNFSKLIPFAKNAKKQILIENCPHTHLPRGEMTNFVVKTIDSPWLGLLWDPANSVRADQKRLPASYKKLSILEEMALIAPLIRHIHVKDYKYVEGLAKPYQHVAIGKGDLPYSQIVEFMKKTSHPAMFSLEPEVGDIETLVSIENFRSLL